MNPGKYKAKDGAALIGALLILALVTLLLPSFWPILVRSLIGLVVAGIVFGLYLTLRTPDEIIALEDQLLRIAGYASDIRAAADNLIGPAVPLRSDLITVAQAIAKLGNRILRRDLQDLTTEIRRLEILSKSFADLMGYLTGDVQLRPSELRKKLEEIKADQLPGTLQTLAEINVAIDESRAQKLASAEQEIEIINQLYAQNSAAQKAVRILQDILDKE